MTNESVPLSVIVPVHNHPDVLRNLLDSLQSHRPADSAIEIIVVDDASDEDLGPVCDQYGATLIRKPSNDGPARCRNIGAEHAHGDLLAFFDADVTCPPGLFESIFHFFDTYPDAGALSFINQNYAPGDNMIQNYGAALEHHFFLDGLTQGKTYSRVRGFTTRNGIVRNGAFEAIQGFDDSHRTNAHEDYDFGKRLAAHCPIYMARTPNPHHKFPTSMSRMLRNYWVRVTLFVPYTLKYKPKLDKSQSSPGEGALRIEATLTVIIALLALLPTSLQPALAIISASLFLIYIYVLRNMYAQFASWSRSPTFLIVSLGVHLISSVVITVGAAWGFAAYFLGKTVAPLRSPLE